MLQNNMTTMVSKGAAVLSTRLLDHMKSYADQGHHYVTPDEIGNGLQDYVTQVAHLCL